MTEAEGDRRTALGRRDYAVLLLLARLGLRSSEVVLLELDALRGLALPWPGGSR